MIPITWLIGGIGALVVTAAIGWVVNNYHKGVRAQAALDAIAKDLPDCPREVRAKGVGECVKAVKATLADCQERYATTLGLVKTQNAAVVKLQESTRKAQERATAAQRRADEAETSTIAERERLDALRRAGNPAGPCPADQAVGEVKKGLKP